MAAGDWYPFFLVDRITFAAAGTGTIELVIGSTEEFEGEEMFAVVSSGTFNITRVQDQGGKGYTNADAGDPIPGALLVTALDQRSMAGKFSTPLKLVPNTVLNIDTTGGTDTATLDIVMRGKKRSLA
mgnify:FL=1